MPYFMDRHDISGASPEEVAAAHVKDLEIQELHGCKTHTYWFDNARGTAFCLIEGPSEEAVQGLHAAAHGLMPSELIQVEPSTVAQFLGRVADPESAALEPIAESAFRAIVFVDMVASTDITEALGDSAALGIARRYRELVRSALLDHGGREVDRAGDGFLISFTSAHSAVACSIDIQRTISDEEAVADGDVTLAARVGIGAGEPVRDGDALFGSAINLTARICDHARAGQIVAARVVRELCLGKRFTFQPLGPAQLKGFEEPTDLELVVWQH